MTGTYFIDDNYIPSQVTVEESGGLEIDVDMGATAIPITNESEINGNMVRLIIRFLFICSKFISYCAEEHLHICEFYSKIILKKFSL